MPGKSWIVTAWFYGCWRQGWRPVPDPIRVTLYNDAGCPRCLPQDVGELRTAE
jgi:hypothetical protein